LRQRQGGSAGEPLDGGGRAVDDVEPGRQVGGVDPPLMSDQRRQRMPEHLGPVGHEVAQPHPFGRVIGMDECHLTRAGGLDLGQRIRAPRGQRQ
jgi:hypothetical protein